jgi:hypothetical protein
MLRSSAEHDSQEGHHGQSPPPHPPHHRDGKHDIVIERVVEKSTAGIIYPMLTQTNYTEWSAVMRIHLQAVGLWQAIRYGGVEYRDDRHTLAMLLRAVTVEM